MMGIVKQEGVREREEERDIERISIFSLFKCLKCSMQISHFLHEARRGMNHNEYLVTAILAFPTQIKHFHRGCNLGS